MLIKAAALIIAAALGIGQFMLNTLLFPAIFASKAVRALTALGIKLIIYTAGLLLLFCLFKGLVLFAAIGFGLGFFPALIVYALTRR